MHQVELHGSYEEMRHQQGLPLKRIGMTLLPPNPKMLRFAKQCEQVVEQYAPELLDEIRGLAEAAELDYEAVLTPTLTAPFEPQEIPSCTFIVHAKAATCVGGGAKSLSYRPGTSTYVDTNDGDVASFVGREWITRHGVEVYEIVYHGGLVKE
ncbi:MAG: DUF5680 domain-containing protein [Chloroflexota bacterium]|nr:DUF5680 domain-containing protein [Chloroflexota bacterium]